MITELLLDLFYIIIKTIINIFPGYNGLPELAQTALNEIGETLSTLNIFLPINSILIVLSLTLVFEANILLYKIINWVIKKIRGSG